MNPLQLKNESLDKLINDVEELLLELMELRSSHEDWVLQERRQRYAAYMQNYYKERIKTDERKMERRREVTRANRGLYRPTPQAATAEKPMSFTLTMGR